MARDIQDIALPIELLELIPQRETMSVETLETMAEPIRTRRAEAIAYRTNSGIDEGFVLCEDSYVGIDDMNRGEYMHGHWIKPTQLNAPITTDKVTKGHNQKRSTAFVKLTSRYVDAGTAKVCEILLPPNDKAFSFSPRPVPDLITQQHDPTHATNEDGQKLYRPARANEMPLAVPYGAPLIAAAPTPTSTDPNQPGMTVPQVPMTKGDVAIRQMQDAQEGAKRAETQIWDWMVGCQHHAEMRKVIFDCARLGVGIIKFHPQSKKTMVVIKDETGVSIEIKYKITPADSWIDPWNVFPDPACGESIRNGNYIFERAYMSERQVLELKNLKEEGYITSQIDKVIAAGPAKTRSDAAKRRPSENSKLTQDYEVWHFHGTIRKKDFELLNPQQARKIPKNQDTVFAIITLIEDTPVRGSLNVLDSGTLPYLNVPWQRRPGSWVGIGVAEQIQVPQRITNAATRALLNNAGISAGPQIIINKEGVTPANDEWEITPNKIWYANNDGVVDDVRKAFTAFDVPNVTKQLMEIVEYGMRLAEESTNIPLVTQGMSGETTPETYGAAQLQNNNANQLLRAIGYQFDDFVTEPLVNMYYEYLLLDPDVPQELKRDHQINAHGSSSLIERAIQDQTIAQMGTLVLNPSFGVDPKKWFAKVIQSKRLSPEDFQYTPEEFAKIQAAGTPPPPQVQVAMIKAKVEQAKLEQAAKLQEADHQISLQIANLESQTEILMTRMEQETAKLKVKLDTDRDTVFVKSEVARVQSEYTGKMEELRLKKELAILDYSSKHQISLDQARVKLADTAMKLKVTKELAAADQAAKLHMHHTPSAADVMTMHPAVQLPGKSPDGKAFQQL